ncbi:MAG: ROK family protein [Thermomicrobium sp.]|nr:ROK family protein [Thermomicrobium sp.]MDW8058820.1 ROK family protein [Thermomicrobium sp.]
MDAVLAVDFGATNLRAAVVRRDGTLLHHRQTVTGARDGVVAVVERIVRLVEQVASEAGLDRSVPVGVVAPGPLEPATGVVLFAPNLVGWQHVPLRQLLEERLGRRVVLGNDGNGAALGEVLFGAAKGCRHLVHVMLGTGVGGGVISHGQLVEGLRGLGTEVGHVPVDPDGPRCHCGGVGCIEAYAGGWALARDGEALVSSGRSEVLRELAGDGPVTAAHVVEAARAGDAGALAILEGAARALAAGLAGLVNVFDPELIVFGGGVARAGELLLAPFRRWLPVYAIHYIVEHVEVRLSALGDDTGLYGAAARAFLANGGTGAEIRLP